MQSFKSSPDILNKFSKNINKICNNNNKYNNQYVNGIFVTIEKHNKLRGCIGTFDLSGNIYQKIIDYTYKAGFEDSRFKPISLR